MEKYQSYSPPPVPIWFLDRDTLPLDHLPFEKLFIHTFYREAPQAPTARIAVWVNTVIKALGEQPLSDRTLRNRINEYI